MPTNGEAAATDFDAVKADLSALKASVQQLLGAAGVSVGDRVGDTARSTMQAAEKKIQERPFLSVLLVFLVGLLLGRLVLKA
jgi:ElaB/YqjD/DUF883 family membrane-anchored ribosome-binding protein